MPCTVVTTFGTYVSSGKSSGAPTASQVTGGRSNSAEPTAKPSAGSVKASDRDPAGGVDGQPHHPPARDGLALEGARDQPIFGVLGLRWCAARRRHRRSETISTRQGQTAGGRAYEAPRHAALTASWSGGRTIAHHPHARLPHRGRALRVAFGVRLGGERDHVGEFADRLEVAELGQAGQPERVQPVAGQQREVRVLGPHDATGGVVEQVALVDRLDQQRVVLLVPRGAAAGGRDRRRTRRRRRPARRRARAARRCPGPPWRGGRAPS